MRLFTDASKPSFKVSAKYNSKLERSKVKHPMGPPTLLTDHLHFNPLNKLYTPKQSPGPSLNNSFSYIKKQQRHTVKTIAPSAFCVLVLLHLQLRLSSNFYKITKINKKKAIKSQSKF